MVGFPFPHLGGCNKKVSQKLLVKLRQKSPGNEMNTQQSYMGIRKGSCSLIRRAFDHDSCEKLGHSRGEGKEGTSGKKHQFTKGGK